MAEMGTALVHNSSFYATTIAAGLLMVRPGSIMRHIELKYRGPLVRLVSPAHYRSQLHLLARAVRTR
jgi:hypothetical protein